MNPIDRRSEAWTATYQKAAAGWLEALGGAAITPPRKALAGQLAILQTEITLLGARFATAGGGAASDLQLFVKLSDTMSGLLESAGLRQALQAPIPEAHDRDAENDHEALRDAFMRVMGTRLEEEAAGTFRNQDGAVICTDDHPQGCRCQPCSWRREHETTPAVPPAIEFRRRLVNPLSSRRLLHQPRACAL